ncbi:MAG: dihydroneopterin triphosphate diphosphatase [Blastocatellia bacterium AA13]|nr:MAG: dihydroneopterin triphosphate diphosphatase [Blastocatellia bacterium AA13]
MTFKEPRSVQVVIFADEDKGREYLLLKRVEHAGGFWQSVTGSLERDETHLQAAVREVREETGIIAAQTDLIDLNLVHTFQIAPQWLAKYAPGVTHNEEVCFALRLPAREINVVLDQIEHVAFKWASYEESVAELRWESSLSAFRAAQALIPD